MAASPPPGLPGRISAADLASQLQEGIPIQVVDVREDSELAMARLPHPVLHLPLSRSGEWVDRLDDLLDRDRPVAVICHAGVRSWHFSCWLVQEHAFVDVRNVEGGIEAWSREVDPSVPRY